MLRIFFERAAKTQSSVSNLGNVYRNSKWSDLKVQNIKQLHLSSFLITSLIFIASLVIIFLLTFRVDYATIISSTSILFWPFVYTLDFISYSWLCIALLVYTFSNKIQLNLSGYLNNDIILKSSFSSEAILTPNTNNIKSAVPSSIARNSIDKNWISLLHNLYSSKVILDSSSYNLSKNSSTVTSTVNSILDIQVFYNNSTTNYLHKLNTNKYTFNTNSASLLKSSNIMSSVTFVTPLNLSTINSSTTDLSKQYSLSIEENLSLANQSRWAFKMSPISEKLVRDNFNFTQAKSLLGSSLSNSLASSNNIWSSNSLSNIKNYDSFLLSPNLTNLNNFEDSRSWSMKKMYFSLSDNTYNLTYANSIDKNVSSTSTRSNSLVASYLLDYNLSFSQLSLNFSSYNSTTSINNTYLSKVSLTSLDNSVYQDSFNNYLLHLTSTSLNSNFNHFQSKAVAPNKFMFSTLK